MQEATVPTATHTVFLSTGISQLLRTTAGCAPRPVAGSRQRAASSVARELQHDGAAAIRTLPNRFRVGIGLRSLVDHDRCIPCRSVVCDGSAWRRITRTATSSDQQGDQENKNPLPVGQHLRFSKFFEGPHQGTATESLTKSEFIPLNEPSFEARHVLYQKNDRNAMA